MVYCNCTICTLFETLYHDEGVRQYEKTKNDGKTPAEQCDLGASGGFVYAPCRIYAGRDAQRRRGDT